MIRRLQAVLCEETEISLEDKQNLIKETILKSNDKSIMTFALFSFILGLNEKESRDTLENKIGFAWHRAGESSSAKG